MSQAVISKTAAPATTLTAKDIQSLIAQICPAKDYQELGARRALGEIWAMERKVISNQ
jgi:hypothetical protein